MSKDNDLDKLQAINDEKWVVGFYDRGHGHGDYAVIVDDGTAGGEALVKCPSREVAEHIVAAHRLVSEHRPDDDWCPALHRLHDEDVANGLDV